MIYSKRILKNLATLFEDRLAPVVLDGRRCRGLVASKIVHDDDVALRKRRHEDLLDIGPECFAIDGPSMTQGASMRPLGDPARRVSVRQWPWGRLGQKLPFQRAQPSHVSLEFLADEH